LLKIKDVYGRDTLVEKLLISGFWDKLKEYSLKIELKEDIEKIMQFLKLNYNMKEDQWTY